MKKLGKNWEYLAKDRGLADSRPSSRFSFHGRFPQLSSLDARESCPGQSLVINLLLDVQKRLQDLDLLNPGCLNPLVNVEFIQTSGTRQALEK
ncbi:hypothetical protein CapIbe_007189 [Capra ibex]